MSCRERSTQSHSWISHLHSHLHYLCYNMFHMGLFKGILMFMVLMFMEEGCKNLTLNTVFYTLRIQQNQPLVNRKWLWWKMVYCNRLLTPRSVYTILWSADRVIIASCMTQCCFLVVDYHGLWLRKVAFAWLRVGGCKQSLPRYPWGQSRTGYQKCGCHL